MKTNIIHTREGKDQKVEIGTRYVITVKGKDILRRNATSSRMLRKTTSHNQKSKNGNLLAAIVKPMLCLEKVMEIYLLKGK